MYPVVTINDSNKLIRVPLDQVSILNSSQVNHCLVAGFCIKAWTLDCGTEWVKDIAAAWRMEGSVFTGRVASSVQKDAILVKVQVSVDALTNFLM